MTTKTETEALSLRLATTADVAAITEIYRPYVLHSTATFEFKPPDTAEMTARLAGLAGVFPWLVCERGGALMGYAYAGRMGERDGYNWTAEASVYIDENRRQRGAGKKLYVALQNLLAAQGYRTMYGKLALPNPASERFHLALGFELHGTLADVGYKFGRPLSVAYYCKRLAPVVEDPPLPKRLDSLDAAQVNAILQG